MTIEGEKSQAFSGITLPLAPIVTDATETIIANSRRLYGSSRDAVELHMHSQYSTATPAKATAKPSQTMPKPQVVKPTPSVNLGNVLLRDLLAVLPKQPKVTTAPQNFTEEIIHLHNTPTTVERKVKKRRRRSKKRLITP